MDEQMKCALEHACHAIRWGVALVVMGWLVIENRISIEVLLGALSGVLIPTTYITRTVIGGNGNEANKAP